MKIIRSIKEIYWKINSDIRNGRSPDFVRKWQRELFATERAHLALACAKTESALGPFWRGRNSTRKHLLLLAGLFPPTVSGGVYRPTALVKYGAQAGWRFSVLAGPCPDQPSKAGEELKAQIPKDVMIRRMAESQLKPDYKRFPQVDGGFLNALGTFKEAKKAYGAAPPSTVMASGPPFHNFIAAALLARYFGAKLVLEYRDEWTECPFPFVEKHKANYQWESWSLSRADLVIFTTLSQLEHQTSVFPQLDARKCVVIPNGWDPDDFAGASAREAAVDPNKATVTLAYFGHLGAMGAPSELLTMLTKVLEAAPDLRHRLKVLFVGFKSPESLSQLSKFAYQDVVELLDQVPQTEACKMMSSVDALLLLNPPALNRYIPGKLYGYLASGTPVLVFGEGGEVATIVKKLRAGIVVSSSDASALEQALRDIQSHRSLVRLEMENWLQCRNRESLALQTLGILNQMEISS